MIVADFHSPHAAAEAGEEFQRIFSQKMAPDQMEEKKIPRGTEKIRLSRLLAQLGLAGSVAEAGRLIEQEAVLLDEEKVTDLKTEIDLSRPAVFVLKVGKRRFARVVVE
jgi:tyrosyl-tRNA synthetase